MQRQNILFQRIYLEYQYITNKQEKSEIKLNKKSLKYKYIKHKQKENK